MARTPSIEMLMAEAHKWAARRGADPYDRSARERLAEALVKIHGDRHPLGSLERGDLILQMMADSFPTPALRRAYIENLERLLAGRPRQAVPGRVVLGLGSGRCGSTTLTAILATIAGGCSTHENPPVIYWKPLDEQLRFHMKRLSLLTRHFPLVSDVSHWWLNALDVFFASFPEGKVIGLHREIEPCVRSFVKIKGAGRGSINHWVPPGSGIWRGNIWDPAYPTYPLPTDAAADPDGAKTELVRRYVSEYNASLAELAERLPGKILLIRTEELAGAAAQQRIFDFVGLPGIVSGAMLNVGTTSDGKHSYRF